MFKENSILGTYVRKVDIKSRIIIPSSTGVEEDDVLCLIRENDLAFKIYSYRLIEAKFKRYRRLINAARNSKDELERKNMRDMLALSIMDKVSVDFQNRIVVPKSIIEEYKIDGRVILCGSDDHLKVFPNDESHNAYIKRLQRI